jgi:hypothetical protein
MFPAVVATVAAEFMPSVERAIVFPKSAVAAEATIVIAESAVAIKAAEGVFITVEAAEIAIAAVEIAIAAKFAIVVKVAEAPIIAIEAAKAFAARKVDASGSVPPPVERGMQEVEPIPGACADEHAVDKPPRSPITIRRAVKRIIGVVSVRTHRWSVIKTVSRPNLDADGDLGLRADCRQGDQNSQQS